jgi:CheY-like chemotaxis protein
VSLPRLLLVDDSQAILAYETASLSEHYAIVTATNGRDALQRLRESSVDAVLLDLSMPEMDGDAVLHTMKGDAELRDIPVIIVSTEQHRADACLEAGAAAYLPKPIRADDLRVLVGRILEDAARRAETETLGVLFLAIADVRFGILLHDVRAVVLFPGTTSVAVDGTDPCEVFDFHGEMVCVLDLATRLRIEHRSPPVDRHIVVLESTEHGLGEPRVLFGVCADEVLQPDLFRPHGARHVDTGPFASSGAVVAVVATERGPMPVADPFRLFSSESLARAPDAIRRSHVGSAGVPPP